MRQQMANGRSRRPRGFVEVDDAFLGGDEHGKRGNRLRDGFQPDDARRITVGRDDSGGIDNASRGKPDGPAVDLAKCLHAARY